MARNDRGLMFATSMGDDLDKWILGAAFLFGIGGSIAFKAFEFNMFLPAIWSGAVILLYALMTFLSRNARLEPEQIGDNSYYLGFVLTLSSLAYTLYELGNQGADADFIAKVIGGFGVALSSTIVGVATRVYLIQFRLDLVARDREAKLSINQAMRAFRAELADATRGTKYMGHEIRQSLDEHHKAIAKAQAEHFAMAMSKMVKSFENSFVGLLDTSREMQASLALQAEAAVAATKDSSVCMVANFESTLKGLIDTSRATQDVIAAQATATVSKAVDDAAGMLGRYKTVLDERSHQIEAATRTLVADADLRQAAQAEAAKKQAIALIDAQKRTDAQIEATTRAFVVDANNRLAAQSEAAKKQYDAMVDAQKRAGAHLEATMRSLVTDSDERLAAQVSTAQHQATAIVSAQQRASALIEQAFTKLGHEITTTLGNIGDILTQETGIARRSTIELTELLAQTTKTIASDLSRLSNGLRAEADAREFLANVVRAQAEAQSAVLSLPEKSPAVTAALVDAGPVVFQMESHAAFMPTPEKTI